MPAQNPPAELSMSLTLGAATVDRLGFDTMRPPRRREHWLCIVEPCLRFPDRRQPAQTRIWCNPRNSTYRVGLNSRSD